MAKLSVSPPKTSRPEGACSRPQCSRRRLQRDYAIGRDCPAPLPPAGSRHWMGFDRGPDRPDHLRYGTRNYLAIISTVNCSASTSKYIAERLRASKILDQFPNVDGVVPIVHKQGCAMQFGGPDHCQLDRTLAGFARHPNVGVTS